ncbi:glycosyltransferase, partial [Vibrio vulnificus]|uniref:glycosyltransferase n=1 Tax=Vibrio vulnificus TaxID=672 RepID=UPI00102A4510
MKISVTIATYNRCDLLNSVLEAFSLQDSSLDLFEVVVCDSYSTDNTDEIIEFWKSKLDICCVQTDNILAKKRNVGIENSKYDYVIFLDDDCVPEIDFISKYREVFEGNFGKKSVFCGNVIYPSDWVNKSNYYRFRNQRHIKSNKSHKLDYKTIVVMNMGFNKKIFVDSVIGVNENFIGYGCEDQELGWRLMSNGVEISKSDANIIHYETTDNILGYIKKIHRASRDGMKTLIKFCPEAAWSIPICKYIEPDY